jgi:hypothetical protein
MKRSTIVAIVVILLSIAVGGVLGFYFYLNSKSADLDTFGREVVNSGNFGSPSLNTSVTVPGNSSTTQPVLPADIQPVATTSPVEIPALRHIYNAPISGMSFFYKDLYATTTALTETVYVANGTSTASTTRIIRPEQRKFLGRIDTIEFMDRATGHIYETSSSTLDIIKLSNTTVPKIQEALFSTKESVLVRDLMDDSDIIRTRFGIQKLTTATSTDMTLMLQDLPLNITNVAISPNKSKIFYTQKISPTGVIANFDGKSNVIAFDSPYKEWLLQWPSERTITITTKPSAFADGFAYKIDVNTKAMQKLIGGIRGLTTLLSPSGEMLAYNNSEQGSPNLYAMNMQTKDISNLYFRTLPEKCIWSQREKDVLYCAVPEDVAIGDYPDVWYQGRIFFNDSLWKINTRTSETRLIANLNRLSGQSIDVINPVLSPSEDYIMFSNKSDLSLWGLRLIEIKKLGTTTATSTATTTPSR